MRVQPRDLLEGSGALLASGSNSLVCGTGGGSSLIASSGPVALSLLCTSDPPNASVGCPVTTNEVALDGDDAIATAGVVPTAAKLSLEEGGAPSGKECLTASATTNWLEGGFKCVEGTLYAASATGATILVTGVSAGGLVLAPVTGGGSAAGAVVADWALITAALAAAYKSAEAFTQCGAALYGIASAALEGQAMPMSVRTGKKATSKSTSTAKESTCTPLRQKQMQKLVEDQCKTLPRACSDLNSCVELRSFWQRNQRCAGARQNINK